jgi:hypothetical protein
MGNFIRSGQPFLPNEPNFSRRLGLTLFGIFAFDREVAASSPPARDVETVWSSRIRFAPGARLDRRAALDSRMAAQLPDDKNPS